jgi:hypothetical protein
MENQPQTTLAAFRALLPHLNEDEIFAAQEHLRRFVQIAIEVCPSTDELPLTESLGGGSVTGGAVDPGTFTNTG